MSLNECDTLIFNRSKLRLHRDRIASSPHYQDVLVEYVNDGICDLLEDTHRSFDDLLHIGCRKGTLSHKLPKNRIKNIVQTDISYGMASHAKGNVIVADEEKLPFAESSFDIILDTLNMHHINDINNSLLSIRHLLKDKGIFMSAVIGGNSLHELRNVMLQSEIELSLPSSPHIVPFLDMKTFGMLLQRTGFSMPVTFYETVEFIYDNPIQLLYDLRNMGESNIMYKANIHSLNKTLLNHISELYVQLYGDEEGKVKATFDILYGTAML